MMSKAKFTGIILSVAILIASCAQGKKQPGNTEMSIASASAKHPIINTSDDALTELKNIYGCYEFIIL